MPRSGTVDPVHGDHPLGFLPADDGADELGDEELAAEAIAADPGPSLAGAIPFAVAIGEPDRAILPEWYMPAPTGGGLHLGGWRRNVVFLFVAALLVIEVTGLCTTYGRIF